MFCNTNPVAKMFFRGQGVLTIRVIKVDWFPPLEMKKAGNIWYLSCGNFEGCIPTKAFYCKLVKKKDYKKEA